MQADTWEALKRSVLTGSRVPFSVACDGRGTNSPPLQVLVDRQQFPESEAVQWRLRLKNDRAVDSPIVSEIHVVDLTVSVGAEKPVVWHSRGCDNRSAVFMLEETLLKPGDAIVLRNPSGGKTMESLPFFNLEWGRRGLLGALGWLGRWRISLCRDEAGLVRVTAGLERARLVLPPGEEITQPRVLLMFWEGDRLAAHNRFRQHMLRHNSPDAPDLIACPTWGGMKTANHLRLIEMIHEKRLPYDCYWMDAGWYGPEHETDEYQNLKTEDWYFHVGDWRANPAVHPRGLKPVSDAAHAAGMRFLLWFEPERAVAASPLAREHPEWFFKRVMTGGPLGRPCQSRCLNFGNAEARRGMSAWIADRVEELGLDVFRQDCNFLPAKSWDDEDTPDRVGISEIRYVEGLTAFWDELHRRFPHLLLDLVQRRDLDSIARAVDMSRSDYELMPHSDVIASQCAMYGLAHWTPLSGTLTPYRPGRDYDALSGLATSFALPLWSGISDVPLKPEPPADFPWHWLRRLLDTARRARPFFRGDFYPLLEHTRSNSHWAAMQFHRPDLSAGMVVVYCRPDSPITGARFALRGVPPGAELVAESVGGAAVALHDHTLEVGVRGAPSATVVFYRKGHATA